MYKWTPKSVGVVSSVSFFLLVIFNKASYKIPYLDWGSGILIFCLMVYFFLSKGKINKKEFAVFLVPILWIGFAIIFTPFAFNLSQHINTGLQVLLLNLIATSVIVCLFSRKILASNVILITTTIWVAVNSCFLVLYLMGLYVYEYENFAGFFENRNDFALQTIILVGLLHTFTKGHLSWKWVLTILSFLLVSTSLSMKGFLFFFFIIFYPILLKSSNSKKLKVLLSGLILFGIILSISPNIQERMNRFVLVYKSPDNLNQRESAFLRFWLILEGINQIKNNPITGIGIDNSVFVLIPPHIPGINPESGLYSHNNYIEMALNAGLVGLFIFYFPLFYMLIKTSARHPYFLFLKTFILMYLLVGIAEVQYNSFISIIQYNLMVFIYIYHLDDNHENKIIEKVITNENKNSLYH